MKKHAALTIFSACLGMLASAQQAAATPSCLSNPSCTLDGETFTTTGGASGSGLTFIANFTTPNQSNTSIAKLVTDYLALEGDAVTYLGRQDGTGLLPGIINISTTPAGGTTGTWNLNPGATGFSGNFVAIHAGRGESDNLFSFDTPGLSGTWGTNNGHGLSNFDLFGSDPTTPIPEPASIALLGASLVGLGLARRRRNQG